MEQKTAKFLYWAPRILSILFLIFLAIFSLDVFEEGLGFWGTIAGLFIHNIPVIVLAIVLWLSWKREIIAGVIFILAGLFYTAMILKEALEDPSRSYMIAWPLIIATPAFI